MASNPSVSIGFIDGGLNQALNLGEEVVLKLGVASAGPYLLPTRATSLNSVLRYKHGPMVRSGAHHFDYSGIQYLMRMRASTLGTIGSVTKTPGASVLASLTAVLRT